MFASALKVLNRHDLASERRRETSESGQMKIIQVQTQAEAAGAQRVSDMVGDGLRIHGHEVRTVFMWRKTGVYDDDPHVDFVLAGPPEGLLDLVRAVAADKDPSSIQGVASRAPGSTGSHADIGRS